jgi:hypothetical protein
MFRALLLHRAETRADLDAFHGIDAHHRVSDVRVEPVEHRFTETHEHMRGDDIDARADGIALLAQRVHVGFELRNFRRIRTEKRITLDFIPILEFELDRPELREVTTNRHTIAFMKIFPGDRPGRHAHRGFARRRASAAAVVAQPVLLQIGEIRVTRAEPVLDLGIILRTLVGVQDLQPDRRTGGFALEYTRENFDFVGLAPLCGVPRLARLAPVEIGLDIGLGQRHAGRATIHDGDIGRTVDSPAVVTVNSLPMVFPDMTACYRQSRQRTNT